MARKNKKVKPHVVTFPEVVLSLGNRLIKACGTAFRLLVNKGQLLPASSALVVVIAAIRLPPKDLAEIAKSILGPNLLITLGWPVAGLTAVVAFVLLRYQRSINAKELARVSKERDDEQRKNGAKIESSND